MQTPTIADCVKFLREHNLLKNWNDFQIAAAIRDSIRDSAMTYSLESDGRLKGIVIGKWQESCFHVTAIAGKGQLGVFMKYLRKTFPDCKKLTAHRYGQFKEYHLN